MPKSKTLVLTTSPISLKCPFCGAKPKHDCITTSGAFSAIHVARIKAAARKEELNFSFKQFPGWNAQYSPVRKMLDWTYGSQWDASSAAGISANRKEDVLEAEAERRKRGLGKTVLIVDDYEPIRKLLAKAFLSDGFKTCGEAADGKEAIELAKKIKPDMVTMDLSMPNMNGLEASSALRELFPKVPIILFTLYANRNLEMQAANVGINLVLLKTVPLPTLIDKAHELMAGATS